METFTIAVATGLLTYFVHSVAACVLALLAGRVLQRPEDRDLVWKAALVAPVVTSALAILVAAGGIGWARVDLPQIARQTHLFALPGRKMMVRVLDDGQSRVVFRQLSDPVTTSIVIAVLIVAGVCVAIAFARLFHRRRALSRAIAGRRHVCELAAGDRSNIQLSAADALQSPVALGLREVCLPIVVMNEFATPHRDTLVAHEVAHLVRRDPMWFLAVEIVTACSAFQPLVFAVVRAFRRDVELICDEAAVRRTGDRHALVSALAMLASPFDPRSPILGAATAYDGSPLLLRATRIASLSLDEPTRRHVRTAVLVMIAALIATLLAVPVVSASPDMTAVPTDLARIRLLDHSQRRLVLVDHTVTERRSRTMVVLK